MSQKFNKYGKRRKACRKTPIDRRRHRQALEEKMTEEERAVATRRFESKLREIDNKRLKQVSLHRAIEKLLYWTIAFIFTISTLLLVAYVVTQRI